MDKKQIITNITIGSIILIPLLVAFLIGYAVGRHGAQGKSDAEATEESVAEEIQTKDTDIEEEEPSVEYVYYRKSMLPLSKTFSDLPEKHMAAAEETGIKKIPESRTDIDQKQLVRIESCELYDVDELTHSIPYLTKGAAKELENIATRFQKTLSDNGLPKYKIVVTSVLRTQEDIKKLRRSGNVNASANSAHCFATTFDISYVHFEKADTDKRMMDNYELKKVLAEALRDERNEGGIYVKYERKQPCFHTTSRK